MRVWGRPRNRDGTMGSWQAVETDADGNNDMVYVTALCQVLLLNLGESPFYGNFGIPAIQSVMQQVWPDFYVVYTQQQYSQFFASLIVSKENTFDPTYMINIITHQGVKLNVNLPVPY